jgi:hypothetical protein
LLHLHLLLLSPLLLLLLMPLLVQMRLLLLLQAADHVHLVRPFQVDLVDPADRATS